MAWAKFDQVKAGDVLIADGGFTCITEGRACEVKVDDKGLFVDCAGSRFTRPPKDEAKYRHQHYLDGQLDDGDLYIGFTLAQATGAPQ